MTKVPALPPTLVPAPPTTPPGPAAGRATLPTLLAAPRPAATGTPCAPMTGMADTPRPFLGGTSTGGARAAASDSDAVDAGRGIAYGMPATYAIVAGVGARCSPPPCDPSGAPGALPLARPATNVAGDSLRSPTAASVVALAAVSAAALVAFPRPAFAPGVPVPGARAGLLLGVRTLLRTIFPKPPSTGSGRYGYDWPAAAQQFGHW